MLKLRIEFLADGCFRDNGALYLDPKTGEYYGLEWTPTLNPDGELSQKKCVALAEKCELLGGGWAAPEEPAHLAALVDYSTNYPATIPELKADTKSDWYWTSTPHASDSDLAWIVHFGGGSVLYSGRVGYGFVRACRRFSPGQ